MTRENFTKGSTNTPYAPVNNFFTITPSFDLLPQVTSSIMVSEECTVTGVFVGQENLFTTPTLYPGVMYNFSFKRITVVSAGNVTAFASSRERVGSSLPTIFNGVSDFVSFGDIDVLDYDAGFKVGFTFSSTQTDSIGIIVGKAAGVGTPRWLVYVTAGKLVLRCGDGTADIITRTLTGFFDGGEYVVVCIVDNRTSTSMKIFIDGEEVTYDRRDNPTTLGSADLQMDMDNTESLAIGSYGAGNEHFFSGTIKNVFISDLDDEIVWRA